MIPELYSDDNGNRVIIRHAGPPGPTGPSSTNPNLVGGPAIAASNHIAVFNGTTGKLIKDGGKLISELATTAALALKVDAVTGKELSDENFTTAEKNKLATLSGAYRGSFASIAAIEANDFSPAPASGDYCLIEVEDVLVVPVFWDQTNLSWSPQELDPDPMTSQEIATALFAASDSVTYNKDFCRIFTSTDKASLDLLIDSAGKILDNVGLTAWNYVEKTSNYIITTADKTINCTNNSFTLTLPTALGVTGKIYIIKNSGTGIITVDTFGIQTIDGDDTAELNTQWESITLQSTGSNWIII